MEDSNRWEKLKVISNIASIVIIPLVIAFLGNLYSKSLKEKEIQGRFVELSLQILKEQPSKENKNIRKWAVDVVNEYSGVKLESSAEKDLIESIPLTMNDRTVIDFSVPISNSDTPIQVEVIFGNAGIGKSLVSIYDSNKKLIDRFESTGELHTLPKLDFKNTQYFDVMINGTSVDINKDTDAGEVKIVFYQDKKTIASKVISYTYKSEGDVYNFTATGKIFLKNGM